MTTAATIPEPRAPTGAIPKAEQSRRTRRLIVKTGARCLADFGYAQTTMLLIAQQAGLSRGPLHYHFADRYAVMAAIARDLPRGVNANALARLGRAGSPFERVVALIDMGLEEHTGPHHFVAMELLMAARNDARLAAEIAPHLTDSEAVVDDWWADYLSILRWPRDRLLAFRHLVVACLRGLALNQVLQHDPGAHARTLELFREVFQTFATRQHSSR